MSTALATVFLLRAPTSEPDRYEYALREASFTPQSLPVLETSLILPGLKDILRERPEVGGVIVTSQRSAEAWGRAVDEIIEDEGMLGPMTSRIQTTVNEL